MRRRSFLGAMAAWLCLDPTHAVASSSSRFHQIYDDPELRDRFFLFLQNIFHLYPEDRFQQLIIASVEAHAEDRAIYDALSSGLPGIKPWGADLTYALPALRKQKAEMARQTTASLTAGDRPVDGYMEIGTPGRYVRSIQSEVPLQAPVFLLHEREPSYGPVDILERGSLWKVGDYLPLGTYEPVSSAEVPDASLDLITNFIGFHHCPPDQLGGFVDSLRRVLRPGGVLLLREHDVTTPVMDTFVALAHDVFNAGVGLTWAENAAELRHFRSIDGWQTLLAAHGFRVRTGGLLQPGDPTDNTLLQFVRT